MAPVSCTRARVRGSEDKPTMEPCSPSIAAEKLGCTERSVKFAALPKNSTRPIRIGIEGAFAAALPEAGAVLATTLPAVPCAGGTLADAALDVEAFTGRSMVVRLRLPSLP